MITLILPCFFWCHVFPVLFRDSPGTKPYPNVAGAPNWYIYICGFPLVTKIHPQVTKGNVVLPARLPWATVTFAAGLPLATQGFTAGVASDNSSYFPCRLQLATTYFTRVAVGNQAFAAHVVAGNQSFAARVATGNQGFSAKVAAGTRGFVIKGCCRRPCSLYLSAFRESHTVVGQIT